MRHDWMAVDHHAHEVCDLQEGKAEPIFERAVAQLPYAARIWAAYAEWSEMQAAKPERIRMFNDAR